MPHPKLLISTTLLAVLTLTACADLGRPTKAQLEAAQNDDHYCAAAHGAFPAPGYTVCRWKLENTRRMHAWQQASRERWTEQQTLDPSQRGAALNTRPEPQYLPIRRDDFSCHKLEQQGVTYIICGMSDGR
jgi:hypothetical protein